MTQVDNRVSAHWLELREPVDAPARSRQLVRALARAVPRGRTDGAHAVVHDLGCGSGSMGRWLAPLIGGPQHWVLHDRDPDLLAVAEDDPPRAAADGSPVTVETRRGDLAGLRPADLAGASLVTASALLDIMTADELDLLVRCCVEAGCPALVTLSVTGLVELAPADPLDTVIAVAFNDHQRRTVAGRALLGGDAVRHTVERFRTHGAEVTTRASPWLLGARRPTLSREWLRGWVGAACEERPELAAAGGAYLARRNRDLDEGRLRIAVHHLDLLARPAGADQ